MIFYCATLVDESAQDKRHLNAALHTSLINTRIIDNGEFIFLGF